MSSRDPRHVSGPAGALSHIRRVVILSAMLEISRENPDARIYGNLIAKKLKERYRDRDDLKSELKLGKSMCEQELDNLVKFEYATLEKRPGNGGKQLLHYRPRIPKLRQAFRDLGEGLRFYVKDELTRHMSELGTETDPASASGHAGVPTGKGPRLVVLSCGDGDSWGVPESAWPGKVIVLDPRENVWRIGRGDPPDVERQHVWLLQDGFVSRAHAVIHNTTEGYRWSDEPLGSQGTRINGKPVPAAGTLLRPHDEIVLGKTSRLYWIGDVSR